MTCRFELLDRTQLTPHVSNECEAGRKAFEVRWGRRPKPRDRASDRLFVKRSLYRSPRAACGGRRRRAADGDPKSPAGVAPVGAARAAGPSVTAGRSRSGRSGSASPGARRRIGSGRGDGRSRGRRGSALGGRRSPADLHQPGVAFLGAPGQVARSIVRMQPRSVGVYGFSQTG
jgi:hypothetical protein